MKRILKIRAHQMVFDELGSGEAIVFLHGELFNRSMWNYQSDIFRTNYRLIIPDLRGLGDSEGKAGIVLLDEFALDIFHLLEFLQIREAYFVGFSIGGQIALEIFRLKPLLVKGLILINTEARSADLINHQDPLIKTQGFKNELNPVFVKERIKTIINQDIFNSKPEVVAHLEKMILSANSEGLASATSGQAERRDQTLILKEIFCPTLIIVGEENSATSIDSSNYISERISGSVLEIIPHSDYLPSMEQSEKFNYLLKNFLEETR